ncbi:MAG: tRNA threonylcarbamoyladenosine dehydratase [Lachnospiraceae bacterium]|nr:tRNA threonylcarbamoyladenosine dehydratase [Lachnospiraceae bacterium]MCI9546655.1 tRNA threonylcarbamoyladenosine dehydratase [Lachnospiraceae bacterium]
MLNEFSRMELLIGREAVDLLGMKKIAIFGLGGVGSYVAEALARCGVGSLTLVDHDTVDITNINRQLFALHSTLGKLKTKVAKERIRDIDENILVHTYDTFYNEDTAHMFDFSAYDYVVDAIDTVSSKLLLIEQSKMSKTPIISSMGTGNKLDPTKFEITDISKTSVCPLAKAVRRELRKRGIRKVKVLYSREKPLNTWEQEQERKCVPGSISFIPSVAGLIIAGEVVKDLLQKKAFSQ